MNGGKGLAAAPKTRDATGRPIAQSKRIRGQVWRGKRSHDETQNDPRDGEEGAGLG